MSSAVENPEVKGFPFPIPMAIGLFILAIGIFLILSPTPPFVKIFGFLAFLIGIIIFAL